MRVTPTSRAVLVVAAAATLVATVPASLLRDALLASLGAIILLAIASAAIALRGLRLEREAPASGTSGELVPLLHRLTNETGRPAFSVFVAEGLAATTARAFFPAVPAHGHADAHPQLRLGARGRLQLAGARLAASDPLGLFTAARTCALPGEVLVRPKPRRLAARGILEGARARAGATRARLARRQGTLEPATVREYRSGDSLRHVHWPLSAHLGTLVVRTFTEGGGRAALLVLDRVPPSFSPRGLAAFERAVSLAAGLGLELLDEGCEVTFVAPGSPPRTLERLRGRAGGTQLLLALALVEPEGSGAVELPPMPSRARHDAFLVTSRGPRAGVLPPVGEGDLRVVVAEGPGPASSSAVLGRGRLTRSVPGETRSLRGEV
ncbi:DUF58 domain-containing protein [bacterium]|nr:DUF58 domain-containing protein [bacterium]